ncbi:TetR/AcrR family transcriptional regulator [Streptomonospora sp. S1-112]|uniref:TetR/AcrR family transcriptional regulator n=1 Tax=Streptomonospora mangrovi TaxID=2883123 RepID=A0A9X3NHI6_9ACTN|nr:TetR/AcrR family transcriptional regulator [Streptomonospora mangrovi]MDA0563288.1 TetR/AcrR family transcriptional regulator [Streptomonospora mangrovi]
METRDRIVNAAAHVMRTRGLARSTTKEIAKAAGFSEATLYKHFRDKTDLFVAVLREGLPSNLQPLLAGLPDRVGQGSVRATLEEVARAAIAFYTDTFPIAASVFSEPTLLEAHRAALRERRAGPSAITTALARYLAAERDAGRLAPDLDPESAADLLIGACLNHAFLGKFPGPRDRAEEPAERVAAGFVQTLLKGAAPRAGADGADRE